MSGGGDDDDDGDDDLGDMTTLQSWLVATNSGDCEDTCLALL